MAHVEDRWMKAGPSGRKVRTARYGHGMRWRARWVEHDGTERARSFRTQDAALTHLAGVVVDDRAGLAGRADVTVGHVHARWWAIKKPDLSSPKTRELYEDTWRVHVEPRWGAMLIAEVERGDVKAWLADLRTVGRPRPGGKEARPLSPSTAVKCLNVLRWVLDQAVEDKRLRANPLVAISVPQKAVRPPEAVDVAGVRRLLAAARKHGVELEVQTLITTVIRRGEMFALDPRDVDIRRGRLLIHQASVHVKAGMVASPTKSRRARSVPISIELAKRLRRHAVGQLVFFQGDGSPWTAQAWRTVWERVRKEAGLEGVRTHDLKHTGISLAIASGADIKVVQQMAGHASAKVTLDVYAHLFEDSMDHVADGIARLIDKGIDGPATDQPASA